MKTLIVKSGLFLLLLCGLMACRQGKDHSAKKNMDKTNPVIYFEIPVNDLERAERFYKKVFGFSFERENIDGYEMSFFPFDEKQGGASGALVKGDVYKPTLNGAILYFKTDNIEETLQKVVAQNGKILYPKTMNEKHGFILAEFQDSEGNRIAVQQILKK